MESATNTIPVHPSQNEPPGRVVFDLSRDGVELHFNVIATNHTDIQWHEIKEQGPVTVCLDGRQVPLDPFFEFSVNIFEVCGLSSTTRSVVYKFYLDLLLLRVDQCQAAYLIN